MNHKQNLTTDYPFKTSKKIKNYRLVKRFLDLTHDPKIEIAIEAPSSDCIACSVNFSDHRNFGDGSLCTFIRMAAGAAAGYGANCHLHKKHKEQQWAERNRNTSSYNRGYSY